MIYGESEDRDCDEVICVHGVNHEEINVIYLSY